VKKALEVELNSSKTWQFQDNKAQHHAVRVKLEKGNESPEVGIPEA
jgi:hypothetical protein